FDKFEALHVADEIGIRKSLGRNFCVAAEKVFLAGIPVGERIITFEDEVDVVKEIKNSRRIGHGQEPHRFVSLAIEVLIPGIERRRKKRPLAPLEGLLFTSVAPNRRRAPAVNDKNHFLEHVLLWFE